MGTTDSIGDMLTRVRNAISARQEAVDIPSSFLKMEVAKILFGEGYVSKYEELTRGRKIIKLTLKYKANKRNVISQIVRVSRPGRRSYVNKNAVPLIQRGFGIAIISTSSGVMTDSEARKLKIGGEVLCYVW